MSPKSHISQHFPLFPSGSVGLGVASVALLRDERGREGSGGPFAVGVVRNSVGVVVSNKEPRPRDNLDFGLFQPNFEYSDE